MGNFLQLPPEVRLRILEFLYDDVHIFPTNPDPQTVRPASTEHDRGIDSSNNAIPRNATSIFQTCRQCYEEAEPVFWRQATFCIYNAENHRILTDANLMDKVGLIQHLVLHWAVLSEWTPTLIGMLIPGLKQLSIVHIVTEVGHLNLLRIERSKHMLEHKGGELEESPGMTLLYSLIASQPTEDKCNRLLWHFQGCQGRYILHLHFLVRCGHIGQNFVPGIWPRAGQTHKHNDCTINYAFQV